MRFLIFTLFVGLALGSPIGQVDEVTTVVPDLLRSDIQMDEATTVVVEILADEAVTASVTERARQGENESDEDDTDDEATTVSSSGVGSSSTGRIRPQPAIPQPFANNSNFLAEYEFSSQFNLGPKDEVVPLAQGVLTQVNPEQAAPVAQAVHPVLPPAVPGQVVAGQPLSAQAGSPAGANPTIVAAGEDEDEDVESDETQTQATAVAAAAADVRQQPEVQRIEESDSDNEITNDDITTVKSFASEYEYTVQQLGNRVES